MGDYCCCRRRYCGRPDNDTSYRSTSCASSYNCCTKWRFQVWACATASSSRVNELATGQTSEQAAFRTTAQFQSTSRPVSQRANAAELVGGTRLLRPVLSICVCRCCSCFPSLLLVGNSSNENRLRDGSSASYIRYRLRPKRQRRQDTHRTGSRRSALQQPATAEGGAFSEWTRRHSRTSGWVSRAPLIAMAARNGQAAGWRLGCKWIAAQLLSAPNATAVRGAPPVVTCRPTRLTAGRTD